MKKMFYVSLAIIVLCFAFMQFSPVKAASLTGITDTMSRLKANTDSTHTIVFTTPTGAGDNTDTITVTFPAGFTIGGSIVSTDFTATATTPGSLTLANAAGVDTWGIAFSGQVLTLTHPTNSGSAQDIGAGNTVTIHFVGTLAGHTITNPVATGNQVFSIAGTFGDTGQFAESIVTDDQVAVTANVDPQISFTFSNNTVGFGHMNSSAARWATSDGNGSGSAPAAGAFSLTSISTNASNGLTITTQDEGNGVASGLYGATIAGTPLIASTGTVTAAPNTEAYGFCAKGEVSLTVTPGADCATGTFVMTRGAQTFATVATPVAAGSVKIDLKASVAGTTKAGAYADTLTIIATGNF